MSQGITVLACSTRKLTVEQFLGLDTSTDGKIELAAGNVINGQAGTAGHARTTGNLAVALRQHLRGTEFEVFNGLMGLRIGDDTLLYPDVAIYGDPHDLEADDSVQFFRFPRIVFEVTSPETHGADHGCKLDVYRSIGSVEAVVLVDPIELHERVAPNEWRHLLLPPGSGVTLRDPALTLTFAEIFASD